jgi:hypothetical protein
VLAADRRHDGLVIDAGIRQQHAKGAQRSDRPLLERSHLVGLPKSAIDLEIEPARVGDSRYPHSPLGLGRGGEAFEKPHTGFAQRLGVGHDVGLRNLHEICRVEELADRDLVRYPPAPDGPELTRQHGLFFIAQPHIGSRFPTID